jgi:MFS family permease
MKPRDSGQGHRAWFGILLVLVFMEITSAFETGMMFGALSTISRDFGDPVLAGWLITGFLLVGASSAAVSSRLGDLFGRKRVAIALLGLAATGSLISALAPTLPIMIVGRSIQGFSSALLPLCVGLVREYLPSRRVDVSIGWLAAMATSSAGVGIVLGGWAVDHFGWPSVFWFSFVHAGVAALLALLFLPPSARRPSTGDLDLLGGILFAPAVAAVLLAITRMNSRPSEPLTLLLFGGGILLLIIWVRREWHHPRPMLDVRLFAQRQIGITLLVACAYGLGTTQQLLVILQIAQQPSWTGIGLGLTATAAAAIKLPSIPMGLLGAPTSGWLASRTSGRFAAIIGALIIVAGWVQLLLWNDSVAALFVATMIIAVGNAALYAGTIILVTETAPRERTSEVNGQLAVVRSISYAAGTVVMTLLLASETVSDPAHGPGVYATPKAFQLGLMYVIGCSVVCLLVILTLPGRRTNAAVRQQSVEPANAAR